MKQLFFLIFSASFSLSVCAQGVKISGTPGSPDPSSGLDVDFTDRGVLIPRLTAIERDAIVNPADALQIFNTTTRCFEFWSAVTSHWVSLGCDCALPAAPSATSATNNAQS